MAKEHKEETIKEMPKEIARFFDTLDAVTSNRFKVVYSKSSHSTHFRRADSAVILASYRHPQSHYGGELDIWQQRDRAETDQMIRVAVDAGAAFRYRPRSAYEGDKQ